MLDLDWSNWRTRNKLEKPMKMSSANLKEFFNKILNFSIRKIYWISIWISVRLANTSFFRCCWWWNWSDQINSNVRRVHHQYHHWNVITLHWRFGFNCILFHNNSIKLQGYTNHMVTDNLINAPAEKTSAYHVQMYSYTLSLNGVQLNWSWWLKNISTQYTFIKY